MSRRLADALLRLLHRKGWVTWERSVPHAHILTVTNAWPDQEHPTRAPFLRYTFDGLTAAGIDSDLLYVRGYKGAHCYLLGCLAMAVVPLARPGKYRLVHSQAGETAIVARFFWSAPVLATYWGSDLLGPQVGSRGHRVKFLLQSRLLRLHAPLMTATTTKSTEMNGVLPARAQKRNWVIPDGVDSSPFRPMDRQRARAALGWPPHEPTVISVGRRDPVKRLWLAEHAADLASREIGGLRWRAISDVPPDQMPLYYNAADLLLHTSASEGSPNVIKEAMACNLPVVATSAGDIAEILHLVHPSAVCEATPEALAHEIVRILRERRRSNGRDRIGPLRLEASTARTLACYRSLGVPVPPNDAYALTSASWEHSQVSA